MSLAHLRGGQSGVVTAICGSCDPECARRLLDLGFAPGACVQFIRRTPLGDPTVFRVCDYEVALRRELAAKVLLDTGGDTMPGSQADTAARAPR